MPAPEAPAPETSAIGISTMQAPVAGPPAVSSVVRNAAAAPLGIETWHDHR